MKKETNAVIILISLLTFNNLIPLLIAQSTSQIIVNPTQGPPDSIVKVTLIGWTDSPGGTLWTSPVAICAQKGSGQYGVFALTPVWNDTSQQPTPWVKVSTNTWTRSYYFSLGEVSEGENIITVRSGAYDPNFIAETTFTVISGNAPPTGDTAVDMTTLIAIVAGGSVIAGGTAIGTYWLLRKRRRLATKNIREVDKDTGISYEKPPEAFVEKWNPPGGTPEKVSRSEVLVEWTLASDNVKQAWRNYEDCQKDALRCQSQINALKATRNNVLRIHKANLIKAMFKLGLKTSKIITDGVQMGYLEKLAAARELALTKNSLAQASLLGESISAIETASRRISEAEMAYNATIQSAGKLKGLLAEWNQRMSPDYVRSDGLTGPLERFRGISSDAREFDKTRLWTLDDNTRRYLTPTVNRLKEFLEENPQNYTGSLKLGDAAYNVRSYEQALKETLEEGLKSCLNDIDAKEKALEAARQTLQSALEEANSVMKNTKQLKNLSDAVGNGASAVQNTELFGGEPDLEEDDPAKLAEGQGELERLQNKINWLQKHYENAMNCMNQNMDIIEGRSNLQSNQNDNEQGQSVEGSSGGEMPE